MKRGDPLRVVLELVAAAALIALIWVSYSALHGPHALAGRIPTHFGADGQPNAWGSPATLWLLPMMTAFLYGTMSLASFFPASFNFPVRVTAADRPRLEGLALRLISWLKAELACLFLWIQLQMIDSVRAGGARLSALMMPAVLVIVFGTIIAHIVAMSRAGSKAAS
jgi:uncharacterized membrane protein